MSEDTASEVSSGALQLAELTAGHPYILSVMALVETLVGTLRHGSQPDSQRLAQTLAVHGAVRAHHAWQMTTDAILSVLETLPESAVTPELAVAVQQLRSTRTEHTDALLQQYVRSALRGMHQAPKLLDMTPEEEAALGTLLPRVYAALLQQHHDATTPP